MVKSLYPEQISVFDRALMRKKREALAKKFQNHDFLFKYCAGEISERLLDINREFTAPLLIGSRGSIETDHPKVKNPMIMDTLSYPLKKADHSYIQGDEELFPIKQQSLDLALSILHMHNINDLPGALTQIRQSLKPDGLFMSCIFGGDTLRELRESLMNSEIELMGGASPRVFPFIDKMQMGDLLQRAGFALPVIDTEIIKVSYNTMFDLIKDIRGMGESNIIEKRNKSYTGKGFFIKAAHYYQEHFPSPDHKIEATFEIIYAIGWAPHSSQQKPLQPGSAQYSLAEALKDPKSGE